MGHSLIKKYIGRLANALNKIMSAIRDTPENRMDLAGSPILPKWEWT
jgi:hypothetical protein